MVSENRVAKTATEGVLILSGREVFPNSKDDQQLRKASKTVNGNEQAAYAW